MLFVALLELRHHFLAELLKRLHHVLVLAVSGLGDEDHRVQMGGFVLEQRFADEVRRTDAASALGGAPERALDFVLRLLVVVFAGLEAAEASAAATEHGHALLFRRVLELLVDVAPTRWVLRAGERVVVVGERVAEELRPLDALGHRLFVAVAAHQRRQHGERRVDGDADRRALVAHDLEVLLDALRRLLGLL